MDILNPFNELAKDIFRQQPIIIVLFLVFMFILLVFYATRTVSKQQSEDHKEKGLLIELVRDATTANGKLTEAIESLKVSQDTRNAALEVQIKEQQTTNRNLSSLNIAFADYHTSLADTISNLFKNQVTTRLDNLESTVKDILSTVKNKPDCNDEVLNRLNEMGRDMDALKNYFVDKEIKRLEDV